MANWFQMATPPTEDQPGVQVEPKAPSKRKWFDEVTEEDRQKGEIPLPGPKSVKGDDEKGGGPGGSGGPDKRPRSWAEEVKHWADTGQTALVNAGANTFGLWGDARELGNVGSRWADTKLRSLFGLPALSPEEVAARDAKMRDNSPIPSAMALAPTSQNIKDFAHNTVGIVNEKAETPAGKIAQEALTGAASMPFSRLMALYGGMSGAAAEGAGQLAEGTSYEVPARIAGALVGPLPAMVPALLRGATQRTLRSTTKEMDPQKWAEAEALFRDAQAKGIHLTPDEVIAQVLGHENTALQTMRRVVEATPQGGAIMSEKLAGRPSASRQAFLDEMDNIAPQSAQPGEIPHRMQEASEQAVQQVERNRTKVTSPFYERARRVDIPEADARAVLADIDRLILEAPTSEQAALQQMRNDLVKTPGKPAVPAVAATPAIPANVRTGQKFVPATQGTPGVPAQPEVPHTNIGMLEQIRRKIRDKAEKPPINATSEEISAAQRLTPALDSLDAPMLKASGELEGGRKIHQYLSDTQVDPFKRSPIGQIADTGTAGNTAFTQQAQIIFPKKPVVLDDVAVRRTIAGLNARDPNLARDFTRQFLQSEFDAATKATAGKPAPPMGAAKFRAGIEGNPQQSENLRAVMESLPVRSAIQALPGGHSVYPGFKRLMEIFEAQGFTPPPGSQTSFNTQFMTELQGAKMPTNPRFIERIGQRVDEWNFGRNSENLAKVLTDPDAVSKFRQLARLKADSAQAQALAAEILGIADAARSD